MKAVVRLIVTLALFSASTALAQITAADALLLVVHRESKELAIFKADGPKLTPVKKIPVGNAAREVYVSPDGRRAYVSNGKDKSITVVDLANLDTIATIKDPLLDSPDGGIVSA